MLPASKTDPFWKGITITVAAAPRYSSCPVSSLRRVFLANPDFPKEDSLFTEPGGGALTRKSFIDSPQKHLLAAGFESSLYSGHSFRQGGASFAAVAGFNDHKIQLLGRWRSDPYELYIEVPPTRILQLSSRLHWVQPYTPPSKPPSLQVIPHIMA